MAVVLMFLTAKQDIGPDLPDDSLRLDHRALVQEHLDHTTSREAVGTVHIRPRWRVGIRYHVQWVQLLALLSHFLSIYC